MKVTLQTLQKKITLASTTVLYNKNKTKKSNLKNSEKYGSTIQTNQATLIHSMSKYGPKNETA